MCEDDGRIFNVGVENIRGVNHSLYTTCIILPDHFDRKSSSVKAHRDLRHSLIFRDVF